jgi:cyclopropane fatty-acyl-phospholipid synthase-like methyltransferase
LREASLSRAFTSNQLRELVGVDQDDETVAVAAALTANANARVCHAGIRSLLRETAGYGSFDLIYSAGLFDYLADEVAQRLLLRLHGMLRSNGRLLVANFTPDFHELAYMECFMEWPLICRDEARLRALAPAFCPVATSCSEDGRMAYLDIRVRSSHS